MPRTDTIRLTRKQLYEQVWSEPITRLAQRYGFSDVWLARICRKNRIPRPPRGYWAIIQAGGRAPKAPLPKGDDNKMIEIITHDPREKKERALSKEKIPAKKILRKIILPTSQTDPHPLISETARVVCSAQADPSGIVPFQKGCLNIQVSRESLPRALTIMDSLIKILTNMGYGVYPSDGSTEVKIDGIALGMVLIEELDTRRRLKAADHNLEGRYEFGYCLYEKIALPSGRLCLSIDDLGAGSTKNKSWRDTDSRKLEDCLKEVVLSSMRMAARKKGYLVEKETSNTGEPSNE